jgi:hypothetical protein
VKEPGSHVAPFLTELFPASKLIFLLRDGRDVVDSWLDAYSEGSWAIPGGAFPVSPDGRQALIRWLSAVWAYRSRAVRAAFDAHAAEDRILVRYEQLREDPEQSLREICAVLGLDPGWIPEAVARHRIEQVPSAARGPGRAVRTATPGAWRRHLTEAEQAVMHDALGSALSEFGYDERPLQRVGATV